MAKAAEHKLPNDKQHKDEEMNNRRKINQNQSISLKIMYILNGEIDYFTAGPGTEANRVVRAETTQNA